MQPENGSTYTEQEQVYLTQESTDVKNRVTASPQALRAEVNTPQNRGMVTTMMNLVARHLEKAKNDGKYEAATKTFDGLAYEAGTDKNLITRIKIIIKELIKAISGNNNLIPPSPDPASNRFLQKLTEKIDYNSVNDNSSPYLFSLIRKAINGNLVSPLDLNNQENRDLLKGLQIASGGPKSHVYTQVVDALIHAANVNPDSQPAQDFKAVVLKHEIAAAGQRELIEEIERQQTAKAVDEEVGGDKLTDEEGARYKALSDQIKTQIQHIQSIAPGSMREKAELRDKWMRKVFQLIDAEHADPHLKVEVAREIFNGVTADLDEYIKLNQKAVKSVSSRELNLFKITGSDFRTFTKELILRDITEHTGQYFTFDPNKNLIELTSAAKRRLRMASSELAEKVLRSVRSTPGEWKEAFNQLTHGVALDYIRMQLVNLAHDEEIKQALTRFQDKNGVNAYTAFSSFITQSAVGQINEEIELSEQYKSLARFIFQENATPEELSKFARHRYASQISTFFLQDDAEKALFNLAISAFERHLQSRIGFNKDNEIPVNLLSGYFNPESGYDIKDIQDFGIQFKRQLKRIIDARDPSIDPEILEYFQHVSDSPALMSRILSFAPGFSLMNTIRGIELVATGRPRAGNDYKDQKLASIVSYAHQWNTGKRGGRQMQRFNHPEDQFSDLRFGSGFKASELLVVDMNMKQDRRNIFTRFIDSVFKGDRWNPSQHMKDVYPYSETGAPQSGRDLGGAIMERIVNDLKEIDAPDPETGTTFQDELKNIQMMGYYSRGGWRFASVKEWWKKARVVKINDEMKTPQEAFGDWGGEAKRSKTWRETYEGLQQYVGASSLWMVAGERANGEIKEKFLRAKLGDKYKEVFQPEDIESIWFQHTLNDQGKQGIFSNLLIKELDFFRGQVPEEAREMTLKDYIDAKTRVYQAKAFQELLFRSPYDFLLNMSQLEPELVKTFHVDNQVISAYDFYFNPAFDSKLSVSDLQKKKYFHRHLAKRYGKDGQEPVQKIAEFWKNLYEKDELKTVDPHDPTKKVISPETARTFLDQALTEGLNKVRLTNQLRMKKADITHDNPVLQQHFQDVTQVLWDYFDQTHKEKFADGVSEELQLGDRKFFHRMAVNWNRDHPGVVPSTNDLNQHAFFEYVQETDEKLYGRLWGDIDGFNKATAKLIDFDNMLMRMAIGGDKKEIMELHASLQGLEGRIGEGVCNKWNYIIAQSVIRFFQEDYRQRVPFPTNFVTGLFMDPRNKSLSTINKTADAMTWKEEDIRSYVRQLRNAGFLAEKGMWSEEQLLKAVGADTLKYFSFQAGPSLASVIFLFTAWAMIKAAYDAEMKESGGKK